MVALGMFEASNYVDRAYTSYTPPSAAPSTGTGKRSVQAVLLLLLPRLAGVDVSKRVAVARAAQVVL